MWDAIRENKNAKNATILNPRKFSTAKIKVYTQVSQNAAVTQSRRRLLHRFLAQTTDSSGYEDETATEEDIRGDLANSLPLETVCREAATRR